jgi:hypothetical protein
MIAISRVYSNALSRNRRPFNFFPLFLAFAAFGASSLLRHDCHAKRKKGSRGAGCALTCGDLRFQISDFKPAPEGDLRFQISDFKRAGGWRRFEIKDGGFQMPACGDSRFQISDFKRAGGWRRFEIKDGGFQMHACGDSRFQISDFKRADGWWGFEIGERKHQTCEGR